MTRVALARAYVVLFIVSTAFPVAASLMPEYAVSRVMGVLDVTVAFVLVATGSRSFRKRRQRRQRPTAAPSVGTDTPAPCRSFC